MKKRNTTQPATPPSLPETGFARLPAVSHATGVGASTLWLWVRQGKFPAPVKISERVTAWNVLAVRDWLNDPAGWMASHQGA